VKSTRWSGKGRSDVPKPSELRSAYDCPVCHEWCLSHVEGATPAEIEYILQEHAYDCFGFPDELRAA